MSISGVSPTRESLLKAREIVKRLVSACREVSGKMRDLERKTQILGHATKDDCDTYDNLQVELTTYAGAAAEHQEKVNFIESYLN